MDFGYNLYFDNILDRHKIIVNQKKALVYPSRIGEGIKRMEDSD